ncbi:hypothetical protein W97_05205 [Coniosporium apollinis CBS 100218]|uniref:Uncharacterized protein n=1 Tax=Coniosporium apollinis (strain CBS 100218) TaxID=1168221 RepID=R7YVU2_CONA1|nr:uncharacterized protein W97_05205 [Coniosporium apollinis CBS 100218]EON65963.1 hypothetical protein W97_05205 [Coniosporium apollinis CBS 100218]
MPFIPHTPEALLPRSDSKNPATTCKGITSSGRPCRRALAPPKASRRSSASALGGVLAVAPHEGDGEAGAAAAFFCWQHKDQAERLANTHAEGRAGQETAKTNVVPLQERSSIDTLVARLGVLEVEDNSTTTRGKQKRERRSNQELPSHQPSRRVERPPTWDSVRGPLIAVSEETVAEVARPVPRRLPVQQPARRKKPGFWASLCCFGNADDDYIEVVRHRKRIQPPDKPEMTFAPPSKPSAPTAHRGERRSQSAVHDFGVPNRPEGSSRRDSARGPAAQVPAPTRPGTMTDREPLREKPVRPLNHQRPSETTNLLSLIPHHLSPQTTSALLNELAKPISPHDDEGYIYIFWLTDSAAPTPPSDAASSLLSPSPARPGAGRRRVSDVLSDYSSSNGRMDDETKHQTSIAVFPNGLVNAVTACL